jgi:hypothetical protein
VIDTFQALAVAVLALLPGASYTYAYERIVGPYGVSFTDRLVRFLAASAIFQAVLIGPELLAYRSYVLTGRLAHGQVNAVALELAALGYVLLPTAVGLLMGRGQNGGIAWVQALVGSAPDPRAWDFLWRARRTGIVRLKLKSGTWLAGIYATTNGGFRSYAAGYPEDGDLYLSLQVQVDPDDGAYVRDDEDQPVPVPSGSGLLVRWAEVEYLDFQEIPDAEPS